MLTTGQEANTSAPDQQAMLRGGWPALAVLFIAQMVAIGSTSYGFSVLLKPLAADFGLPRGAVNRGLMTMLLGVALFSPLVGRALDRASPRMVVTAGAITFAAGWAAIAATSNLIVALASAFFLLAPGVAALGPLTASTLVSRWFTQRRGMALGIVSVSASTGGFVVVQVLASLVESIGWRLAIATVALAAAVVIVGLTWVFVPRNAPHATNVDAGPRESAAPINLFRIRDFWLIGIAVGSVMASNGALLASLVAYGTDLGFTLTQAAALMSIMSGAALVGKLVIGALSDHIDPRWLFLTVVALNLCLLAVLIAAPAYPILVITMILAGAAVGGVLPLWAMISGQRFGTAMLGRVMGLTAIIILPLNLLALYAVGSLFDATGNYVSAFKLLILPILIAAVSILPVRTSAGK